MLRVITRKWGNTFRLELYGLLGGDWVPLLEQHWRAIARQQPSAKVTVVLSDVDFIDSHGERLLRRLAASGVRLVASGCMNRHLIETLEPDAGETKGVGHGSAES
jgi:hypothetical protein